MQRLAKRVDRAGADVAEDDAQRTQHQQREALLTRLFGGAGAHAVWATRPVSGTGHSKLTPTELAGCDSPVATQKQWFRCGRRVNSMIAASASRSARKRRTVSGHADIPARRPSSRGRSTLRRGAGMRAASGGRLATVRSWPALTASPAASAASAAFPSLSSALAAVPGRRGRRRKGRCRARCGRRRSRAPAVMPPGSASANSETRKPPFFSRPTTACRKARCGEVPAVVGGRLRRIVGHQRHLVGLVRFDEPQEILGRIALDVEFGVGEFVVDQRPQLGQVGAAHVPLVGARMDGEPMRPGLERNAADARRRSAMAGRADCAACATALRLTESLAWHGQGPGWQYGDAKL